MYRKPPVAHHHATSSSSLLGRAGLPGYTASGQLRATGVNPPRLARAHKEMQCTFSSSAGLHGPETSHHATMNDGDARLKASRTDPWPNAQGCIELCPAFLTLHSTSQHQASTFVCPCSTARCSIALAGSPLSSCRTRTSTCCNVNAGNNLYRPLIYSLYSYGLHSDGLDSYG